jgi:hypothetical protein
MRSHDIDAETIGPGRSRPPTHEAEASDLAARAVADGRPGTLDAGAVLRLQTSAGNASVSRFIGDEQHEGPSRVRQVLSSRGGQPLDPGTAQLMSERFGEDFGSVRIHTDAAASESARAVNAHAYTVGSDIVFQSDRYSPDTASGQRTLAHELTHVVQQRSGPVAGTPVGGGVRISHPSDSFERAAEQTADRVMSGGPVQPPAPSTAQVQRQAVKKDGVDQGSVVQRQAAPEEEEEPAGGAGFMAQRQAAPEEEEEPAAGAGFMAQRQAAPEEEEEPAKA